MGFIYSPLNNYASFDLCVPEKMLSNPNIIMGLGDGGAHVGFILDGGSPAWLMTYWQKERKLFGIGETIRRLTSDTAEAVGLFDRGVIKPSKKADINVIDYDCLTFGKPYVAYDLPTGALPGWIIEGQQLDAQLMAAE